MEELQTSQQDSSATSDSGDTSTGSPLSEVPQQSAGSNEQGANAAHPNNSRMSYDELQNRHNGLMSKYRKEQSQWENTSKSSQQEIQQYQQREKDLLARVEQLEKSMTGASKPTQSQEPNFEGMTNQQIMQYLKDEAKKEAVAETLAQLQQQKLQEQQSQEEREMDERREQEEQRYQSRWDQLLKTDPSVNVKDVEQFMQENRVYDPIFAYNFLYSDVLTKQAVSQAKQETVEKIATNQKNRTEGAGQAGILPPPTERKYANSRERNAAIVEEYRRQQGAKA